jgi:hypothetical protein
MTSVFFSVVSVTVALTKMMQSVQGEDAFIAVVLPDHMTPNVN